MKTTVTLPILPPAKYLVTVGEKVTSKSMIAETVEDEEESIIAISELLHINPRNISKYLKKNIGEEVEAGDLLAEKTSLLTSSSIKSPAKGKIKNIDLAYGTMTLVTHSLISKKRKIYSPVNGKVTHIDKNGISLEVEGHQLKAVKGKGREVLGEICYIKNGEVGILDIDSDVYGKIVVCHALSSESFTKLEALEAKGLVTQKAISEEISLPWVQVDEDVFSKLEGFMDKNFWLRPENKQIVVFD